MSLQDILDILIVSLRDGFVQVSAFVAVTVLLFSYIQYRTGGRVVAFLENNKALQPIAGALLGLTPGCGGAIVAMPLYVRGTISFGSVVATLGATAGDAAFVIIATAPVAGAWAYGLAFVASVAFGYAVDYGGLGVRRIDEAVARMAVLMGVRRGFATSNVATAAPSVPAGDGARDSAAAMAVARARARSEGRSERNAPKNAFASDPALMEEPESSGTASGVAAAPGGPPDAPAPGSNAPGSSAPGSSAAGSSAAGSSAAKGNAAANDAGTGASSDLMTRISHGVHVVWWVVAAAGLVAGVLYLARGAPEVAVAFDPTTFFGLFTISGLLGTGLSFFLYFVGRHYIDEGGRLRERFGSTYETFEHAAMETSMVTVWVIAGYLIYEYTMGVFALDLKALSQAAGVFAPLAGAALGLVPGCTPQIIFAQLYAIEEAIPFSALAANAISQDGDALFPLMAIDMKAAVVATIYTTIPAVIVGVLVHYFWPFADFGFGVLA